MVFMFDATRVFNSSTSEREREREREDEYESECVVDGCVGHVDVGVSV